MSMFDQWAVTLEAFCCICPKVFSFFLGLSDFSVQSRIVIVLVQIMINRFGTD